MPLILVEASSAPLHGPAQTSPQSFALSPPGCSSLSQKMEAEPLPLPLWDPRRSCGPWAPTEEPGQHPRGGGGAPRPPCRASRAAFALSRSLPLPVLWVLLDLPSCRGRAVGLPCRQIEARLYRETHSAGNHPSPREAPATAALLAAASTPSDFKQKCPPNSSTGEPCVGRAQGSWVLNVAKPGLKLWEDPTEEAAATHSSSSPRWAAPGNLHRSTGKFKLYLENEQKERNKVPFSQSCSSTSTGAALGQRSQGVIQVAPRRARRWTQGSWWVPSTSGFLVTPWVHLQAPSGCPPLGVHRRARPACCHLPCVWGGDSVSCEGKGSLPFWQVARMEPH